MSRIGKLPVKIPAGVKASVADNTVSIEGAKGKLSQKFGAAVNIKLENDEIHVSPASASRQSNAMHGTARSIIAGMVKGVVEGYSKVLEIKGVGFKAELKGKTLTLALGYAHPCVYQLPEGINVAIGETPDRNPLVTVSGASKHMVGQVASDIKHFYPVEPYKGKGVRIHGEYVRRKEGKKTA
ncbi:MAG: 50S ribosomal protein L6 [Opitutales bacterium]|nr:50S ribosomal protein L6 [Opitutales bacterium]